MSQGVGKAFKDVRIFALSHPGGSLGRRLLLKVEDVMHKGKDIPIVANNTPVKDALIEITEKRLGMTAVVNEDKKLVGIFTDGDLRRSIEKSIDFTQTRIDSVMTTHCQTISSDMLAAKAVQIMEDKSINALIVVNEHSHIIGALNMHDLLKAGVV